MSYLTFIIHYLRKSFKKRPLILVSAVILLLLIPIYFFSVKYTNPASEAAWFDDSFAYRKSITVTNNTTVQSNVYISTTLNTSDTTKFQIDGGDLRFTKNNGELLPYYIVSGVGTSNTVIHVLFDSFPAGIHNIFYYYGNANAPNGFSPADFITQASNYTIGSLGNEEKTLGPVAYWKFDEGVGSTAYDSSPSKLDSALGTGSSSPVWVTSNQCVSNSCLSFDGSNDYLQTTQNSLSLTDATISLWIKPASWSNSAHPALLASRTATTNGFFLFVYNQTQLTLDWNDGTQHRWSTGYLPPINQWTHLLIVRDNSLSTTYLYVNGKLQNSTTYSANSMTTSSNIRIGADTTSFQYFYQGMIDDVKLYSYNRTFAQIKADYNAGLARQSSAKGTSVSMGSSGVSNLSNGLVAYWKMDEVTIGTGSTAYDASGNNLNGIGTGTSLAAGKFGNGRSFNGSSDYISSGTSSTFAFGTGSFSFGAWVYTSDNSAYKTIISKGAGNSGVTVRYYNRIEATTGTFHASIADGTNEANIDCNNGSSLANSAWHHAMTVIDRSSQTMTNYVDGKKICSTSISAVGSVNSSQDLRIGRLGTSSYYFSGYLDDARVYDKALSQNEITALYNYAPGPVAYYAFDEGIGSTAYDKSGNGQNGYFGLGSSAPTWSSGKYGKGLYFNGNTYVIVPDNSILDIDTQDFTVQAWVNPTVNQGTWNYFVNKGASGSLGYGLAISAGNQYSADIQGSGGSNQHVYGANTLIAINQWAHVAASYTRSGNVNFYVNGNLKYSTSISANSGSVSNSGNLYLGAFYNAANRFKGSLDEIKIYNYARSPDQIIEDMNGGHPLGGSPVGSQVGYWKFDEGYGVTARDSGFNNISSNILNATWTNDGKYGKALSFNGSSSYVSIPYNITWQASGDYSITGWFKANSIDNHLVIYSDKGNNPSNYDGRDIKFLSGKLQFNSFSNNGYYSTISSKNSISVGNWYYFAATKSDNLFKLYLNGIYEDQYLSTNNAYVPSGDNGNVGRQNIGGSASGYFNGLIDEIKMYNAALSDDEVKVDYNRGQAMQMGTLSVNTGNTAPPNASSQLYCIPGDSATCASPVAEWGFDKGVGTTVSYDTSGNLNDGYFGVGNSAPTWTSGKVGKAIQFNGINSYVNNTTITYGDNYTVEAWIKPADLSVPETYGRTIVASSVSYYPMWLLVRGNQIRAYAFSGLVSSNYQDSNYNNIRLNNWYHVSLSATRNGSAKLYINGTLDSTFAAGSQPADSRLILGDLRMGRGLSYKGIIDEVKVYNYIRTPAQIAWDYNKGAPIAWWKMDECQGTTLNDSSGNNILGTISIGVGGSQASVGNCSTSGTAWGAGATGRFNYSLNFDGTDDYVDGGTYPLTHSYITLNAWVKASSISNDKPIIDINTAANTGGSTIGFRSGCSTPYSVAFTWRDAAWSSGPYPYICGSRIDDGTWKMVTGVYDSTGAKLYVNAILVNSVARGSYLTNQNQSLNIAKLVNQSSGAGYNLPAQLDDLRIYNYPLTAAQVKQLYNGAAISFGPASGAP